MANPIHVTVVKQGAEAVREYRDLHPDEVINLRNANLERVNLTGDDPLYLDDDFLIDPAPAANLSCANGQGVNLRNAYLYGVTLVDADLSDADLCRAYLPGAELLRANLTNANLTGVDLRGANLREAVLSGARCNHVDFYQARLRHADLRGADLTGACNLRRDQVQQAYTDHTTKLPSSLA